MPNPFKIFAIRKDERWIAIVSAIVFAAMNFLLVRNHFAKFTLAKHGNIGAWSLFNNKLHFSGYDPYAYMTLTQYSTYYVPERHPLITPLLYPFYMLNHWIMRTFDFNACTIIMAVLVVAASTYSVIFMYRTLKEIMGLKRRDSIWLTALLFSFASIMTSSMSPDHFIFSLLLLVFSLYVFGRCIKSGKPLKWWKAGVLYFLTTGITLTNGVKELIGTVFANGRQALKLKNIALYFVLPSTILIAAYAIQYETLSKPRKEKSEAIIALAEAKDPSLIVKDSINKLKNQAITGERISEKPFLKWIDLDSSRPNGIVEALFGESFQLHKDYLLGDIYLGRPAEVHYHSWLNYCVNAIIVLLFVGGIVVGRRNRIVQMLLCWFAIDFLIHVVLGFGLNEAYINGTHWMFFIPVAMACLYAKARGNRLALLRWATAFLTVYLWGYNGGLIISYLA